MALRNRVPLVVAPFYGFIRPSSDVSDGLWTTQAGGTALSTVLDETTRDDSDYVKSDDDAMDTFEVHLSDPASTFQNGTLKIVIGKETNNADVIHFYVELRQGTTVIASWAYADVAYGLAMKTERLTDAQFAAITDFTDLRVRVTSGPGWTPTAWLSTSKLVAWYDFSNEASLTIASGTVSSAADLSGNGLPASQGTAASQAVYSRTGWPGGSKGAVIPDGFNDGYDFTPGLSYNSTTGFSSACILYNSASGNRTVFSHWGGTSAPCLKLVGDTVDLTRNFVAYLVQTPAGSCPAGVRILGCDLQSNSSVVWIDGISYSTGTDPACTTPVVSLFNDNGVNLFGGGPFGEILFGLARWTTDERELVDGYLAWKWGHVSNLGSGHAYKNRPPFVGD
jgi:hypothetical protein